MRVQWFAIDEYNYIVGPYDKKSEVREAIENSWDKYSRISLLEHIAGFKLYPHLTSKEDR